MIWLIVIIGIIIWLIWPPMGWLLFLGVIIWLFAQGKRRPAQSERLTRIEQRLDLLEQRLAASLATAAPPVKEPIAAASPETGEAIAPFGAPHVTEQAVPIAPAPIPEPQPEPTSLGEELLGRLRAQGYDVDTSLEAQSPGEDLPSTRGMPARPSPIEARWRRIEQLFIENWTGILGTVVVVAGVTFLAIYTALRLAPFYRFLMTVGAAGALGAASVLLHRRGAWRALAEWVRSAAAAIFLFACAASGGLPGLGMQWVEAPTMALMLLLLGMATNLYLAWIARAQTFASLHVILSVLPLVIVPQSAMSLGIASVVSLFGVVLSFRARWDQHLLIVIVTYVLYHVSWYLRLGDAIDAMQLRTFGVLSAIAVFATVALAHYRKDYSSQKLDPLPLLVHTSNWVLLALALLVYLTDPAPRSLALALSGVVAYLLARRGRRLGIRWLYLCDTLIGQTLAVAALVSLHPLIADTPLTLLAIFLETLLFLRLVVDEGEDSLATVAWVSANLAGMLFVVGGLLDLAGKADLRQRHAFILLLGAATTAAAHLYLSRKHGERLRALRGTSFPQAAMGWLVGAMVIAGLLNLSDNAWLETVALLSVGGLLLVSRTISPPGLQAGSGAALMAGHMLSWLMLLFHMPWETAPLSRHIGPLTALAAFTIWVGGASVIRQVAIYLLGLDIALAAYLFLNPVSSLIPGVAWLVLSLLALELANRLERPSAVSTLHLGYGYIAAFIVAYALVIIQAPAYLGLVRARLLIELFGLGVILYWWLYRPRQPLGEHPSWLRAHPFFLEFGLIAVAVANIVEVPAQWRPVVWPLLGLALLSNSFVRQDARFRLYSLFFFWISVADVAVIMSVFESPSPRWHDRPDIMSAIGIALQVIYIVMSRTRLALIDIRFPSGLGALSNLGKLIASRRNLWVYYPFFAGVAIFLFWRFDRSLLTLLWAAEAFMVFVLSAVLRENQFRHVALAALGVCLARLLFIDMAEANLGLRGLVFVGVGLLMLGMNAVYNRYRARFQ